MSSLTVIDLPEMQPTATALAQVYENSEFVKQIFDSGHMKESTRKNLSSDWRCWMSFITTNVGMDRFALMTMDEQLPVLMDYANWLVDKAVKANTMRRRFAGLSKMLRLLGIHDGVTGNPRFDFFKSNLLSSLATPSKQAEPFPADYVLKLAKSVTSTDSIKLIRANLIVQIAHDTLCRASELAAIHQSDIKFRPAGDAQVFIRKSKSDQAAIGSFRALSKTATKLVREWIVLANRAGRTTYLLCPISAHSNAIRRLANSDIPGEKEVEKPISYNSILDAFKLFGSEFSAHSTRVGGVLELAKKKKPDYMVQQAGGWKSSQMISYYSRMLDVEDGVMRELFEEQGR